MLRDVRICFDSAAETEQGIRISRAECRKDAKEHSMHIPHRMFVLFPVIWSVCIALDWSSEGSVQA